MVEMDRMPGREWELVWGYSSSDKDTELDSLFHYMNVPESTDSLVCNVSDVLDTFISHCI